MRPTGLSSGFYKDTVDSSIFCGEWCIYETRTGPESLRWFWALHAPSKPRRGQGRVRSELEAMEGVGEDGRVGMRG
jgi:hypothetical protein